MKTFIGLLNTLMIGGWVLAIAIFSIQNIQAVSLKFLVFESIDIPVGVLLALCSLVGMILGWLFPLLLSRKKVSRRSQ